MTEIRLGSKRPFNVVTTVICYKLPDQVEIGVDINSVNGKVRLCFTDYGSLMVLREAIDSTVSAFQDGWVDEPMVSTDTFDIRNVSGSTFIP